MTSNITIGAIDFFISGEQNNVRKLAIMAGKIAFYNFEWRYVTLVLYNSLRALGVETFIKKYKNSVNVKYGTHIPRHRVIVSQFILFFANTKEISYFLEWLCKSGYNNDGKYLVLCASDSYDDCDPADMFKVALRLRVLNIIFLRISNDKETPEGFTYFPIQDGKCSDTEPVRLPLTWDCADDKCFYNQYDTKLKNLHRCSLNVTTFEQHPFMYLAKGKAPYGLDGDILALLMNLLNSSLNVVVPSEEGWGHYANGVWDGTMGVLKNNSAHMAMASAPLTHNKYGNFQISYPYTFMDIVWVSNLPDSKPSYEKLLHPFKPYCRYLIFFIFVIIIIISYVIRIKTWTKMRIALGIPKPKISFLFYSCLIFLGGTTKVTPRNGMLRTIVCLWIWLCFIIRTAYQVSLINSLKQEVYEDFYESFHDVIKSKTPFGGPVSIKEYYSLNHEVFSQWVDVPLEDTHRLLREMSNGESSFTLAINEVALIEFLTHHNYTIKLQRIPEKILSSPTVVFFRKNAPLKDVVDRMLSFIRECGIADHLYHKFMERSKSYFKHLTEREPDKLNFTHFSGLFIVLLIGWTFAILFFVIELICGRYERNHLNVQPNIYT